MKNSNQRLIKTLGLSALIHTLAILPFSLTIPENKPELTYIELYEAPGSATNEYKLGNENKSNKETPKNLEGNSLEKTVEDINEVSDEIMKSLNGILLGLKLQNKETTPQKFYHELYSEDERNEVTYGEFFRVYTNGFLLINIWQQRDILKELNENPDGNLIYMTIKFNQNGRFRITRLEAAEGTKHGMKIIKHYRKVFQGLNRNFVPLNEVGLKAPHYEEYVILNARRHFRDENKL